MYMKEFEIVKFCLFIYVLKHFIHYSKSFNAKLLYSLEQCKIPTSVWHFPLGCGIFLLVFSFGWSFPLPFLWLILNINISIYVSAHIKL